MAIINPGLRMARRGPGSIQIGLGPGGLILEELSDCELAFVEELRHGIPDAQLATRAAILGVNTGRAGQICTTLERMLFRDSDVLTHGLRAERLLPERSALFALYQDPSHVFMARRAKAVVHLLGLGRTGAVLAAALVSAGVGTLLLEDDRAVSASDVGPGSFTLGDIGLARSLAVRRHLQAIDATANAHVVHDGGAGGPSLACLDLAVVVGHDVVRPQTAARFLAAERPHLFVLLREQDGTIGPLVIPGETACAECVERHRNVQDPRWLEVCGQLGVHRDASQLESVSLAMTLAGTAATHALLFLDAVNQPRSFSSVLTFHPDNGRWTQQDFDPHPSCGCQWQNQPFATISSTASP